MYVGLHHLNPRQSIDSMRQSRDLAGRDQTPLHEPETPWQSMYVPDHLVLRSPEGVFCILKSTVSSGGAHTERCWLGEKITSSMTRRVARKHRSDAAVRKKRANNDERNAVCAILPKFNVEENRRGGKGCTLCKICSLYVLWLKLTVNRWSSLGTS